MIESSFFELRSKDVVNIVDGKCLGRICDIVIEICSGQVLGFIVPNGMNFASIFRGVEEVFIPYQNICKIGKDVILVELNMTEVRNFKVDKFSDVATLNESDIKKTINDNK